MSQIITDLQKVDAIKYGEFTLKSGETSSVYVDLRTIVSYPKLLNDIAEVMWSKISNCDFDVICGVPYTALPIATCMSVNHNVPMVMRRKEKKDYGLKKMIEGVFESGQKCLIVEDVVTSGTSVLETVKDLHEAGLEVVDAVVLVNREQGGEANLKAQGFNLHSILTLSQITEHNEV